MIYGIVFGVGVFLGIIIGNNKTRKKTGEIISALGNWMQNSAPEEDKSWRQKIDD